MRHLLGGLDAILYGDIAALAVKELLGETIDCPSTVVRRDSYRAKHAKPLGWCFQQEYAPKCRRFPISGPALELRSPANCAPTQRYKS